MKTFCLRSALALLVLGGPAFSARALDPARFNDGFAPLTPALTQFFTDLEAISAGSTVTEAQHATLLADLTALPPGPAAPTAGDLDQLATNFGAVAVAGLVNDDLEYQLAVDFDVDADDPDSWLAYVRNDVDFALNPPAPVDPTDPGDGSTLPLETAVPVGTVTTTGLPTRKPGLVINDESYSLKAVYDVAPSQGALFYVGNATLITTQFTGEPVRPILSFDAVGLPSDEIYTVSVVRRSDGARVVVGQATPQTSVPTLPTGTQVTPGVTVPAGRTVLPTVVDARFGAGMAQALPDGFAADDVQSLVVTDAAGHLRFRRKLTASKAVLYLDHSVRLPLYGPASNRLGKATVGYKQDPAGTTRNRLHLAAHGLPALAAVTLLVDGVKVGAYTTTAQGRLAIHQRSSAVGSAHATNWDNVNPLLANVDPLHARSLSLVDASGNVLLSGGL